jgi:hypothetical protein
MHPGVALVLVALGVGGWFVSPFIPFWIFIIMIVAWIFAVNMSGDNWILGLFILIVGAPILGGIFLEKTITYFSEPDAIVQQAPEKSKFVVEYNYEDVYNKPPEELRKRIKEVAIGAINSKQEVVKVEVKVEPKPEPKEDGYFTRLKNFLTSKPLEHLNEK